MTSRFWRAGSNNAIAPGCNFLADVGVGSFTPASLTGLDLWLAASDSSTKFTDAGTTPATATTDAIQQWNSKSPASRNVSQATLANRPLNHSTGVYFDGAGDFMKTGTDQSWCDANGQQALFFAVTPDAVTATKQLGEIKTSADIELLRAYLAWDFDGKPEGIVFQTDGSSPFKVGATLSAGAKSVVGFVVTHNGTTGTLEVRVNGASATAAIAGPIRTDAALVFVNAGDMPGHYHEVVHVNGTISGTDVVALESYMAA
jgi:hypothetical protein